MPFDAFIGNAEAASALRRMVANDRLPGALLLAGPEGVGKSTLALMLAKSINCERRKAGGDDFCGECLRCRRIDEWTAASREDLARRREMKEAARRVEGLVYFDVQLIEPLTRYILTEQVRLLRSVAYTRPFELPRRVFIVDQAQAVHWQAADLLLKVLEEPPETTTVILVAPNAYELRPTLRSRCRRVQFLPVEEGEIAALIAKEGRVAKAQVTLVARLAGGSVARAKTLDLEGYRARRRPWTDFLAAIAGSEPQPGAAPGRGERRAPPDWKRLFDATRALTADRETFEETLRAGQTLLRDLLQTLEAGDGAALANLDLAPQLKAWAPRLGFDGIAELKAGLEDAYRLQIRNVNQQLGLEALAAGFAETAPA